VSTKITALRSKQESLSVYDRKLKTYDI